MGSRCSGYRTSGAYLRPAQSHSLLAASAAAVALTRRLGRTTVTLSTPCSSSSPTSATGFATMVDVITAAPSYLYSVLAKTEEKPVRIKLPKFDIKFTWDDLKTDLCKLGLSLPFSRKMADLRGMYEDDVDSGRPTFLTKVAHTAVVKVNEMGTEAAAFTLAVSGGGGPPPDMVEFVADHPFTFFIMEERSGVIVFVGYVLDPAGQAA
uniref:Serpin domain-containing protein n=1 Tax=Leersia perrieri TaxID=77586 RepID=A0A0D9XTJ0_9ORYZ